MGRRFPFGVQRLYAALVSFGCVNDFAPEVIAVRKGTLSPLFELAIGAGAAGTITVKSVPGAVATGSTGEWIQLCLTTALPDQSAIGNYHHAESVKVNSRGQRPRNQAPLKPHRRPSMGRRFL